MPRKYQIFLSSPFTDLKEARQALIMATLQQGHIPFGMEMLVPGARKSLEVIEERIVDSDIFVVMIGARLGSRASDEPGALTFTEREYDLAVKHRLPVLAFLLDEKDFTSSRNALLQDDNERHMEDQLRAFRNHVTRIQGGSRIVGYFAADNIDGLADQYSRALTECVQFIEESGPTGGWVPGREVDATSGQIRLSQGVSDNPFFREVAQSLNRFVKLSKRTNVARHLKEGIASYFWQRYFAKLHSKHVKAVYFESGSSIAYVSRAFITQIRKQSDWWYDEGMNKGVRVLTNNILTYLDFLFQTSPWKPMDVRLQPAGPVSDDYGGTYGVLNSAVQQSAPTSKDALRKSLSADAERLVGELRSTLEESLRGGLVLMTASGVDTRDETDSGPYPGPHVGSYSNMLLKRCLLSLPCPKVLFLHPDKWGFEYRFNNCHAVCDHSFPWSAVKSTSPLAIALAADSPQRQEDLATQLALDGFGDVDLEEVQAGGRGPWSVIAANQAFAEFFAVT